jgi:hypothetical protein
MAAMTFASKPFDEEVCEDIDPLKHKSAHEKYSAAMDKLDAKGICPACLDRTTRDNLGTQLVSFAEALNARAYPCPP